MRVATGMEGLHYVLHAPQGDTYADLLFTMIERRDRRPPVTYTTFSARDLGGDTAELFKTATQDAYDRFQPQAMIVGPGACAQSSHPGSNCRSAGLSAQGKLGRRRDILSIGSRAGRPFCAGAGKPTSTARDRFAATL
jgi:hypothetical protein